MLSVKIDEDTALNLLKERVDFWTDDIEVRQLFYKMYEKLIDEGCFENCEFDPMNIVDNDYINDCTVLTASELPENESHIVEAVDDEENPNLFLVRM